MLQPLVQGAAAPEVQPTQPTESHQYETVRHMLFGSLIAVKATIKLLHRLNYAEPNDWSQPISTGRPNEVMAILTKKVTVA
ncbi:MAG: hypothetical protein AAFW84_32790 [Cyanobacteria bacterium J06635_15]